MQLNFSHLVLNLEYNMFANQTSREMSLACSGQKGCFVVGYVLEAIDITKKFPGVLANDRVCLRVKKGEVMGLIGENGAGKSTLLKILNGVYRHGTYMDKIFLEGKEIQPQSPRNAMNLGIGYVPQEINVLENFSVAENVYMADLRLEKYCNRDLSPERSGKSKKSPFVDFKSIYDQTEKLFKDNHIDLDPRADVRKLSIGQQQMLMIARALATNPKVLILDEPTSSLASSDVEKLFRVVRILKEKGTSIIFVSHKLNEIMELTDRVTIMRDGRNISVYEKKEYDSKKIITDVIGREITNLYPSRNNPIGEEVFRVENLTVDHPYIVDKHLVENISFNVRKGEVVGMAGLVGAGRTEVCMAIFGVIPVKSGNMFLNDEEIKINSTEDAIKNGIALVSEDRKTYGLNFVWDIKKNIAISNLDAVSEGPFVSEKSLYERVKPYFEKMSIKAPNMNVKVGTLSGGNQQKSGHSPLYEC